MPVTDNINCPEYKRTGNWLCGGGFLSEKMLDLAHHKCRVIYRDGRGLPIVLLHGYNFDVDVWRNIGVIGLLERENTPFIALDMPYGRSSKCSPKTGDVEANVAVVRDAVQNIFSSVEPVLVGTSLGGYTALKYATSCFVRGLLLVSPVGSLEETLVRAYNKLKAPTYIIHGSKDRVVLLEEMQNSG